jgi:hypothetical protein
MELNELVSESRKRRQKRRRTFKLVVSVVVAVGVVAFVVWLFLWSPVFRVDRVVAEGNVSVPEAKIVALAQTAFAQSHYGLHFLGARNMLAWPSSVASTVLAQEPELASATLEKDYGAHEIVLSVVERKPLAIWCVMGQSVSGTISAAAVSGTVAIGSLPDESCYWFDETGTVFAPTFDTEGDLLSAVHDYSEADLTLGGKILPERFTQNMLSILSVLRASGLRLKEVRLNDIGLEEIQATTYDGPDVYFSLRFPADGTLTALQNLMAKSGFGKLQYVDFRTEGRMYYQ